MLMAASLMCADFWRLGEQVRELEAAGVDLLHFDVMDGLFVPNLGLGPQVFQAVRRHSALPCDVHLMVRQPAPIIPLFRGAEWIVIHAEAQPEQTIALLDAIRQMGAKPGLALNPTTDPMSIVHVLAAVDMILVMTVTPGFAGQTFIPAMVQKVERVKALLRAREREDVLIGVDGSINTRTLPRLAAAGARLFVLGSTGLFLPDRSFSDALHALREAAEGMAAAQTS